MGKEEAQIIEEMQKEIIKEKRKRTFQEVATHLNEIYRTWEETRGDFFSGDIHVTGQLKETIFDALDDLTDPRARLDLIQRVKELHQGLIANLKLNEDLFSSDTSGGKKEKCNEKDEKTFLSSVYILLKSIVSAHGYHEFDPRSYFSEGEAQMHHATWLHKEVKCMIIKMLRSENISERSQDLVIIMSDTNCLKGVNELFGKGLGTEMLKCMAIAFKKITDDETFKSKWDIEEIKSSIRSGDEFDLAILFNKKKTDEELKNLQDEMMEQIMQTRTENIDRFVCTIKRIIQLIDLLGIMEEKSKGVVIEEFIQEGETKVNASEFIQYLCTISEAKKKDISSHIEGLESEINWINETFVEIEWARAITFTASEADIKREERYILSGSMSGVRLRDVLENPKNDFTSIKDLDDFIVSLMLTIEAINEIRAHQNKVDRKRRVSELSGMMAGLLRSRLEAQPEIPTRIIDTLRKPPSKRTQQDIRTLTEYQDTLFEQLRSLSAVENAVTSKPLHGINPARNPKEVLVVTFDAFLTYLNNNGWKLQENTKKRRYPMRTRRPLQNRLHSRRFTHN